MNDAFCVDSSLDICLESVVKSSVMMNMMNMNKTTINSIISMKSLASSWTVFESWLQVHPLFCLGSALFVELLSRCLLLIEFSLGVEFEMV